MVLDGLQKMGWSGNIWKMRWKYRGSCSENYEVRRDGTHLKPITWEAEAEDLKFQVAWVTEWDPISKHNTKWDAKS